MSHSKLSNFCLPHHIWGDTIDLDSCTPFGRVEVALKGVFNIHEEARGELEACTALSAKSAEKIEDLLLRIEKIEQLLTEVKQEAQ